MWNINACIKILVIYFIWSIIIHACGQIAQNPVIEEDKANVAIDTVWEGMEQIVESIQAPVIPDKLFVITDFGAVADGKTDCTEAFRKAIVKCSNEGGGKVIVPKGEYFTGPVHLESNIKLHLEEGAIIRFSTNPKDYLPLVLTRWEGVECMNFSPLIYAFEKENIAITGSGILDGMASAENWWPWKGREDYGWEPGTPNQENADYRPALFKMNETEVPVEERLFGEGKYLRPQFIQPYNCKNILIEGLTIKNSPMWIIHPVLCENVIVRDVKVISHGPNSDGCDPEASKNVLIERCYFDTGDDCIAIKSGRNHDGFKKGIPSENIVIRNCIMKDGHGGVVIGSEVSGGARNIFVQDCQMNSPHLERAIRFKTNKARGGIIEKVYIRNIEVGEVAGAVITINMKYYMDDEKYEKIPVVKNIYISNVTSQKSRYGLFLMGLENSPIRNVTIRDCNFNNVDRGNVIMGIEQMDISNIIINNEPFVVD